MKPQLVEAVADIIRLFSVSRNIGWVDIRENSVYRILYLSSILYKFRYPDDEFQRSYDFSVQLTGPYSSQLKDAITFLESSDILAMVDTNALALVKDNIPNVSSLPENEKKVSWLETIMYIIGIYGESKIYEFVIRDPEYRLSFLTNATRTINLGDNNKSVMTLNDLKREFEDKLQADAGSIPDDKYLELYFEYVFSRILTGHISLG